MESEAANQLTPILEETSPNFVSDKDFQQMVADLTAKSFTPPEEVRKEVKKAVKSIICRRALQLKAEILDELKYDETEQTLDKMISDLKRKKGILVGLQQNIAEKKKLLPPNHADVQRLETGRNVLQAKIRETLAWVNDYEKKRKLLMLSWDHFRINVCKDGALKAVNREMAKRPNGLNLEKWLDWHFMLPAGNPMKTNDADADGIPLQNSPVDFFVENPPVTDQGPYPERKFKKKEYRTGERKNYSKNFQTSSPRDPANNSNKALNPGV